MDADTKITVLKRIAARFNEAGITWALGASMLLYFKRIAPEFHDIDLTIADHIGIILMRMSLPAESRLI